MNLLILEPQDFTSAHQVTLTDRRFHHMREVHQAEQGQSIRVGLLNGHCGEAIITAIDERGATLEIPELLTPPPAPLPLTLVMALPRPKMLKRTLQTIATMGVKELWLINSIRVDKSYWSTPILSEACIREHLILGLEQAGDTVLPTVHLRKRFKPFAEDELPALALNKRALVAHPYEAAPCPVASDESTLLAIGPEGGFIPYEVEKLNSAGLASIHLGRRILRVETAVPVLLSRLFPILG